MEADLRAILAATTALTDLVSTRIYWSSIPQAATDPNVVLYKITGAPGLHMQGSDGLDQSLVQMNIRALSFASMIAVRNALVSKLHGFHGTEGATDFRLISLSSERQNSEKPGTVLYFACQLDFDVYSRAAA